MGDTINPRDCTGYTHRVRSALAELDHATGELSLAWDRETVRKYPQHRDIIRVEPAADAGQLEAAQERWRAAQTAFAAVVAQPVVRLCLGGRYGCHSEATDENYCDKHAAERRAHQPGRGAKDVA